MLKLLTG